MLLALLWLPGCDVQTRPITARRPSIIIESTYHITLGVHHSALAGHWETMRACLALAPTRTPGAEGRLPKIRVGSGYESRNARRRQRPFSATTPLSSVDPSNGDPTDEIRAILPTES